ncbi:protein phosphatase CheZ [Roseibium aestuarii]|uniref:Protein phosphatase CheZ n=1 Tax=Roseibium aestuarii TaxID=2600299 RepID=A0ABW4JXR7_9HYPH|nr:protein phosphatase CheZ [Roseibium aestuarii]
MQTAEAIDDSLPLDEAEYHTLEQTLLESQRGRRFLNDFLKRNKTPETQEILAAIQRMEKSMSRKARVPDLDRIRLDIAEMHEAIERTKGEIANIKAEESESNRFVDASHELDAIITQTEGATQTILEAAEQIQEQAWILREAGADSAVCDEIDAKSTEIFMACSFQDLTGQRTNKVVQVLRYLESRINTMINIWGIEDEEAATDMAPVDLRPDAHLLNGPQRDGLGTSQSNIDDLLTGASPMSAEAEANFEAMEAAVAAAPAPAKAAPAKAAAPAPAAAETVSADFDFDAIEVDDEDMVAGAVLDADDIDKLFDTASGSSADEGDADDMASAVSEEEDIPEFVADMDVLDEAAIDKLFDQESEAAADADWEAQEAEDIDENSDPLKQLSEAERQALFN